jgi:hypothetical protein
MKNSGFEYNGKTYHLAFNLNVMEAIQAKYGTLGKWGEATGANGDEPNISAIVDGFEIMINEGEEIAAEEAGEKFKALTHKQVGRIISGIGINKATELLNTVVSESTANDAKNA